ncbi:hypothetical protein L3X38_006813 [Prunus dulcis]|uniref:Uncharacterized protein n=1 Tax=Prunus dulcis TaxID=3755 RepID=A0AAD4ZTI8_PRUDU|nr:hypothetical protein L3X38_006813 [Prunus dulcis]
MHGNFNGISLIESVRCGSRRRAQAHETRPSDFGSTLPAWVLACSKMSKGKRKGQVEACKLLMPYFLVNLNTNSHICIIMKFGGSAARQHDPLTGTCLGNQNLPGLLSPYFRDKSKAICGQNRMKHASFVYMTISNLAIGCENAKTTTEVPLQTADGVG